MGRLPRSSSTRHRSLDDRGDVQLPRETPDLRNAIEALLADRVIDPAVTKAFGCSIDRS
jgi:hypothetical protein